MMARAAGMLAAVWTWIAGKLDPGRAHLSHPCVLGRVERELLVQAAWLRRELPR